MSDLMQHFYNKSGVLYNKSTEVTDTTFPGDVVASPPSGERLVITKIRIQPSAAAEAATVKVYAGDGTTFVKNVCQGVLCSGFLLSVPELDMSDAPLVLKADEQLQAIAAGTTYVSVRGFVI